MTVNFDDGQSTALPTRKALALLAYLAVPAGRYHPREKLTALLWGEKADIQARQSFRQALASLRRLTDRSGEPIILSNGDLIALDPGAVTIDVATLQAALAAGDLPALLSAMDLWRGEFLDGLRVDEAPFEEWRAGQRQLLRANVIDAGTRLLQGLADGGPPDAAIDLAQRIVAIDFSREDVHRTLMRLFLAQGRRAAALQQYHACADWLHRELDAVPEDETTGLYRELLRTGGAAPGRLMASPPAIPLSGDEQPDDAPLIGRTAEIRQLRDALTAMLDGGGRIVMLSGEAGVGKSRLLREFASEAAQRHVRLSFGQSHETEQILPLRLWIDTLRDGMTGLELSLRDRMDNASIARLTQIFPELSAAGDRPAFPSEQYGPLFDAMVRLIEARTDDQPIVMVLEDLHWADSLSIRFLAFLGRRIRQLPILIVCSMRPEDSIDAPLVSQAIDELKRGGALDELAIRPLSEADTHALIRALSPAVPSDQILQRITDKVWSLSEGNPFVINESVKAAQDRSLEAWLHDVSVVPSVAEFVAGRLQRLPDQHRHVVAVAATIGRQFPFSLLTRAAEMDAAVAADTVEDLVRRRVLMVVGESLDFVHARIRAVAYDRLIPQRRALLHLAAGAALENVYADNLDAIADQLGHHYSRAGDPGKAITYLVRFAELAGTTYALEDAYRALTQAEAATARLPRPERDRWTLDLVLRQAFILSSLGRTREVSALLRTHADLVGRVDDPLLSSEYYFRLGLTCIYLGDKVNGRVAAERALAEGERSGSSGSIGKALYVMSLNAYESGRPKDGIADATRAVALLTDEPGARIWLGLSYWDLALNCLVHGDVEAALDAAARADAIGEAAAWPRVRALAGHVMAWAYATRGDCDAAIETATRSLEHSRDPTVRAMVSSALGLAYLERGDGRQAVAILEPVVEQLRKTPVRSGEARNMALLGEAWLLAGDARRGQDCAARALEISQAEGMRFNVGLAQRALGRIAAAGDDMTTARRCLDAAYDAFTSCDATLEAARTQADLTRVLSPSA